MMTKTPPFISIRRLRECTGNPHFDLGKKLFEQGRVSQVKRVENRIYAKVKDRKEYDVELVHDDGEHEFYCDCIGSLNLEPCLHAISVALFTIEEDAKEDENEQKMEIESEESQIRRYFLTHYSKETLVDKILIFLKGNESEWQRCLIKTQLENETCTLATLKEKVEIALPRESCWEWGESGGYFERADDLFELIWVGMDTLPVAQQWILINHVLERLNQVMEQIDDSNGERAQIETEISMSMPLIFAQLPWSEEEKANWLFDHLMESHLDIFPCIREDFAKECRLNSSFIALCQEAVDSLKNGEKVKYAYQHCAQFLIERTKDWREIIKIKKKVADGVRDYLDLCQCYLDNKAPLEAASFLIQTRSLFKELRDKTKCDRMDLLILNQLGEKTQAWKMGLQIFDENVNFEEYQTLLKLKTSLGIEDAHFLVHVEQTLKIKGELNTNSTGRFQFWSYPADELLAFYLSQNELDKACLWVETHKISPRLLLKLADKRLETHPKDALTCYLGVASFCIEKANNEGYKEAINHLKTIETMLAPSPKVLEIFYQKVAELDLQYKKKRNMHALFKEHYGQYL